MAEFTLKQLRYFEALSRHLHFGMAADTCAISQPALSMQIKELEDIIGAALFERSARQVRLTQFGMQFATRARDILRAADELADLARASATSPMGRLRLGVIPTIAPYLLPTLLADMKASFSELDLHIRESLTSRLIQELSEGRIDAAIVALPVNEPSFTELALFDEDFVLVRPACDANLPAPQRESLQDMRLLLLEEGHCFRDQALAYCAIRGAPAWEGLDGSSLSTLVQMVGAEMGVTLLPQMAVGVEERAADVSIAQFKGVAPSRTVGMIWRKTNPLAGQFTQIAKVMKFAEEKMRQGAARKRATQ